MFLHPKFIIILSAWEEIAQTFPKRNMKGFKWKETERSLITVGWEVKVYPTAKKQSQPKVINSKIYVIRNN